MNDGFKLTDQVAMSQPPTSHFYYSFDDNVADRRQLYDTWEYLEQLIVSEKQQMKAGRRERMMQLEGVKERAAVLEKIKIRSRAARRASSSISRVKVSSSSSCQRSNR